MTHITVDLTEDDPRYPIGDGLMPEVATIADAGHIAITFGETEIRMTYSQFDRFVERINAWRDAVPADVVGEL